MVIPMSAARHGSFLRAAKHLVDAMARVAAFSFTTAEGKDVLTNVLRLWQGTVAKRFVNRAEVSRLAASHQDRIEAI